MNAPRRWLEDPEADEALREVLRGAPGARALDAVTRRRLGAKVARASALPAAAAGWLFVKSATAALGVVLGTGAIAVATGIAPWSSTRAVPSGLPPGREARALAPARRSAAEAASPVAEPAPQVEVDRPARVSPTPLQPTGAASVSSTLSAETALLEKARRQMRTAPELALAISSEHSTRFPRGQLASERTLIQIEALHRLGRDAEARTLGRGLLGGRGHGLYAERIHQLLGESVEP